VSRPRTADFEALLEGLLQADVEFIVVGGLAAVLHGAGIATADLDIVPRRKPENAKRLNAYLASLDAWIDEPMRRQIRPDESYFLGRGQVNLSTSLGPMDVLCQLHDGRGYEELFEHSEVLEDEGLELRVLDLPSLIQVKASTGRAKDRLAVPVLLALQGIEESESEP